jgi:hypothetical protein
VLKRKPGSPIPDNVLFLQPFIDFGKIYNFPIKFEFTQILKNPTQR